VPPKQTINAPRAWLYLRVSHDPTGRGLSVRSQEEELRAWAAREGWRVVGVTTDNDMSASRGKKSRPGYREIHQNMVARKMDILACWESSRAQRDLQAYVQTRNLCEEHSVLFAYKGRVYDLTETNDRFITGLDALLDERYSDEVRDRVLRGHKTSRKNNTPRGRIPFGYMRTYDVGTGAMIGQAPDPRSAPIVRELFERIIAGDSLHSIAGDLNKRGVPTPLAYRNARCGVIGKDGAGWTNSKIRSLVSNVQTAGFRVTRKGKKEEILGETSWKPLVSAEQFRLVRQILSDPERRTQRGIAPKWLLSGILECGVCGARCRRLGGKPSYVCHGHNFDGKACVSGRMAPIDVFVVGTLLKRLARPDALAVLQGGHDADLERTDAAKELAELEAELEEYRGYVEQGKLTAASMVRAEARLLPAIEEARRRCTPAWVPPALVHLVGMQDVEAGWHGLELLKQREVIASAMRVVLHRDTRPRGSHGFDAGRVEIIWRSS
jgi:DNA invertase Pin-like site-specific DNA recombinase